MYKPIGWLEFEVFENLTSAYLHQIAHEIMLWLVNNLQVKCMDEILAVCVLFVICTCVESDEHNLFM